MKNIKVDMDWSQQEYNWGVEEMLLQCIGSSLRCLYCQLNLWSGFQLLIRICVIKYCYLDIFLYLLFTTMSKNKNTSKSKSKIEKDHDRSYQNRKLSKQKHNRQNKMNRIIQQLEKLEIKATAIKATQSYDTVIDTLQALLHKVNEHQKPKKQYINQEYFTSNQNDLKGQIKDGTRMEIKNQRKSIYQRHNLANTLIGQNQSPTLVGQNQSPIKQERSWNQLKRQNQQLKKQKKRWDQRVHSTAIQSINKDNIINDLKIKLDNIARDGERQFNNTFELIEGSKQISKSFYKAQCIAMIEKDLEEQKKFYQINNAAFSDILKEVVTRLRKLIHTLNQTGPEWFQNQNVSNICEKHPQMIMKTIRKYFEIIQKQLDESSFIGRCELEEQNNYLKTQFNSIPEYHDNCKEQLQSNISILVRREDNFKERFNIIKNNISSQQCMQKFSKIEKDNAKFNASVKERVTSILNKKLNRRNPEEFKDTSS